MSTDQVARNQQARDRLNWRLATAILLVCFVGGCAKSAPVSISGKVTHKGQPVVQGDVTFFQSSSGRVAQSALDAEGNYSLNLSQGALPTGKFKVTVTPSTSYVEVDNGPNGKDVRMVEKGGESIPPRYRGRNSTDLSATITGGEDVFDFELK